MEISRQLPTGTPVTVYGQPGRVLYYSVDGLIAVRLTGEIRVDLWSPEQVEAVAQ